jgi:hypothetical protein
VKSYTEELQLLLIKVLKRFESAAILRHLKAGDLKPKF